METFRSAYTVWTLKRGISLGEQNEHDAALERLVVQRLIERSDALSPEALIGFTQGWRSLLDLLERADLWLPEGASREREVIGELVGRIRAAQTKILDEGL